MPVKSLRELFLQNVTFLDERGPVHCVKLYFIALFLSYVMRDEGEESLNSKIYISTCMNSP